MYKATTAGTTLKQPWTTDSCQSADYATISVVLQGNELTEQKECVIPGIPTYLEVSAAQHSRAYFHANIHGLASALSADVYFVSFPVYVLYFILYFFAI